MNTELRVSYWIDSDADENGFFEARDSSALTISLPSQTLLFENNKVRYQGRNYVAPLEEYAKKEIEKMTTDKAIIHKIWIP